MSTDSSSSSQAFLAPTPSTSTNAVGEALLAPGDDTSESDSPPAVPWRTGADTQLPFPYTGHTNWRAHHRLLEVERPRIRRRLIVMRRRRRRAHHIYEHGISRDFFLIILLCFVLACFLILSMRPIALEILWYIDDPY